MTILTNYQHSINLIDLEKRNVGRRHINPTSTVDKMAAFLVNENKIAGKRLPEIQWHTPERIKKAAESGWTMPSRLTFKRDLKHRIICPVASPEERNEASRIYHSLVKSRQGKDFAASLTCERCSPQNRPSNDTMSFKLNLSNYASSFKLRDITETPKDQPLAVVAIEMPDEDNIQS